jgi:hypothetical protein
VGRVGVQLACLTRGPRCGIGRARSACMCVHTHTHIHTRAQEREGPAAIHPPGATCTHTHTHTHAHAHARTGALSSISPAVKLEAARVILATSRLIRRTSASASACPLAGAGGGGGGGGAAAAAPAAAGSGCQAALGRLRLVGELPAATLAAAVEVRASRASCARARLCVCVCVCVCVCASVCLVAWTHAACCCAPLPPALFISRLHFYPASPHSLPAPDVSLARQALLELRGRLLVEAALEDVVSLVAAHLDVLQVQRWAPVCAAVKAGRSGACGQHTVHVAAHISPHTHRSAPPHPHPHPPTHPHPHTRTPPTHTSPLHRCPCAWLCCRACGRSSRACRAPQTA